MSIKVGFDVKFGHNEIDIPINTGQKVYKDDGSGLSHLFSETFTIINQIPTSQTVSTKKAWEIHKLKECDRRNGIYDQSSGTMTYKANTFTVYCKQWDNYKPPIWSDDGYYSIAEFDRGKYWTANVGDLIVFADIADVAPTTLQEFNALVQKYKENGGLITSTQAYINFKPNGNGWQTNHIEMVKG